MAAPICLKECRSSLLHHPLFLAVAVLRKLVMLDHMNQAESRRSSSIGGAAFSAHSLPVPLLNSAAAGMTNFLAKAALTSRRLFRRSHA